MSKTFKLFGITFVFTPMSEIPCKHSKTKYVSDGDGGSPMYRCNSCNEVGSHFDGKFIPVSIDNLSMFL